MPNVSFSPAGGAHPASSTVFTYLLTPWCRVLLEKLTGLQLVKKFPAFHGTRRFITLLASVRHLSVSWASPIQSIYQHPTSWRSILMLSTNLRLGLPSGSFPPVLVQCIPRSKGPGREADHKSTLTAEDSVYELFSDVRCSHRGHCEGYCIVGCHFL